MSFGRHAILTCLMLAGGMRAFADDLNQKLVSEPGAYWGVWGSAKANFVAASDLKTGAAQRVTIPNPSKPWDAGAYAPIDKPVHKGDMLVLMFRARAQTPPPGSDLVMVSGRIYEANGPGMVTPDATFLLGKQWKLYTVVGKAERDYPAGTLSAGMTLGTGDQVIEFGPVSILDFGTNFDPASLPSK
jgi:hypothetical protein